MFRLFLFCDVRTVGSALALVDLFVINAILMTYILRIFVVHFGE